MIGRFHIVAIAALAALVFGWLFTGRVDILVAAFVALDWCLVNLLNRVVDLPEDARNGIPGTAIVAAAAKPITYVAVGALVGSFALSAWLLPALTPWRLAYHALGIAYNYPVLPTRARRLKATYAAKNLASALGFMLTVFAYPLAAGGPLTMTPVGIAVLAAWFFTFELAYEVVYDMRDVPGDAAEGVPTFPVVHGLPTAARLVDGLLITSNAVLLGGYAAGLVGWREVVMVVAPAFLFIFYRRCLPRGLTTADCVTATLVGAGLLAAYGAWIAAGLPLDLPAWWTSCLVRPATP